MTNAVESWSWDGQEGERTQVEVYARAVRVKLLLNGREIGSARVGRDARVTFTAVYRPGSLTAVAYDADGVEIARTSLATAGKETRLHAVPEAERIALGDGLAYVRFMYADAAGTVKPLLRGDVHIEVENGEILGFGSACPYYERSYRSDTADTYYGEAMAIIRPCETGILSVKASSPYGEATARIEVR